jgi:spore maturation protein CgeB
LGGQGPLMRILFAAYLRDPSASGRQRMSALESLGHELQPFALDGYDIQHPLAARLRRRVLNRHYRRTDQVRMGKNIVAAIAATQPDLVWAEKPLMLLPEQMAEARKAAPRTTFVCFLDDDPFGLRRSEHASWRSFIDCIPLYDAHFVKKTLDVAEFKKRGAKRVLLFMHGVHTPIFFPSPAPSTPLRDITFVGTPLDHRVGYIEQLIARYGVPIHVHGNDWQRTSVYWRQRTHFHPEVVGDAYAELLRQSKICLGFVSSSNRDEYSMRSFEIPGCGSFLLAERTPTHLSLFEEGKEAEYFSSIEECADKCSFYLRNESARHRIAAKGYERCCSSRYFLKDRVSDALVRLRTAAASGEE